ncbi:hypothetical protein C1H46_026590 [Malus baccata]|uniref:Uncharacterized protein n=1 Tax=Malus baccata TaxID=106549 RepID=A0A540LNK9_MALBA|nr:hypothetical protein C1H46_026590 [Malus baccata]
MNFLRKLIVAIDQQFSKECYFRIYYERMILSLNANYKEDFILVYNNQLNHRRSSNFNQQTRHLEFFNSTTIDSKIRTLSPEGNPIHTMSTNQQAPILNL